MHRIAPLLHNIRSAHNVGSIFRTADAAGAERVFLSGYTPTPIDAFGRPQPEIAKTALGAEKALPWEHYASAVLLIERLRREGWRIVGVEQDPRAEDYQSLTLSGPTVFVFGNEVRGLSPALRKKCDQLIDIPMHGTKESLNVSVAAGVILFQAARG
jgi:tRNA G18 (ribose-2'-O)-methylase SpoU